MTKILKKIKLSFVAAIVAVLGISTANNVAPHETKANHAYSYVSLGDKMTTGFGFEDYYIEGSGLTKDVDYKEDAGHKSVDGFMTQSSKSYPALVKEALEVEYGDVTWTQLAANSFRIDDIYYELVGSEVTDEFYDLVFDAASESEGAEKWNSIYGSRISDKGEDDNETVHNQFFNAIEGADYITLSAGLNNFGDFITGKLLKFFSLGISSEDLGPISGFFKQYDFGGNDTLQAFCDKVGLDLDIDALYEFVFDIVEEQFHFDPRAHLEFSLGDFATIKVREAIDSVILSFVSYCYYMNETTKLIRAINPDAEFVVIGLINPYDGLKVKYNEQIINIGEIYNYVLRAANLFTSLMTEAADSFKFVDPDTFDVDRLLIDLTDDIENYGTGTKSYLFNSLHEIMSYLGITSDAIKSIPIDDVFSNKQSTNINVMLVRVFANLVQRASQIDVVDINKTLESISISMENSEGNAQAIYWNLADQLDNGDFDPLIYLFLIFGTSNGVWNMPNANGHIRIANAVMDAMESDVTARQYAIKKLQDKYGPTVEKIVDEILSNVFAFLSDVKENVGEFVGKAGEIVSEKAKELTNALAEKAYELTFVAARKEISGLFDEGGELVTSVISMIDSYVDGKLEQIIEFAQGKVDGSLENLQDLVNDALAAFGEHSDEIVAAVKEGIVCGKKLVDAFIDEINNQFATVVEFISFAGQFVRDEIANAVESVIAFIQAAIVKAYECVTETVVLVKEVIVSVIDKIAETIVNGIEYLIDVVEEIKDRIDARYAYIQSKFDAINDAIDGVYEKVDNYVTERIAEVVNFVQEKVDGVLARITEKTDAVVSFIEEKAMSVVDCVKAKADLVTECVDKVVAAINEKVAMIVEFVHKTGTAIRDLERHIIETTIVTVQDAIIGVLKSITALYKEAGIEFVNVMQRVGEALVYAINYVANLPTDYHEEFGYVVAGYHAPESVRAEIERLLEIARNALISFIDENKYVHEYSAMFKEVEDFVAHARQLLVEAEEVPGLLSEKATATFLEIVEAVSVIFPHEYTHITYDENGVKCSVCDVCGWVSYDVKLDYEWEHDEDEHYWTCIATATFPYGEEIEETVEKVPGVTTVYPDVIGEIDGYSKYTAVFDRVPNREKEVQDVTAGKVTYSWTDKGDACVASVELFRDENPIDPLEVTGEVTFVVDKEKFIETGMATFEYLLSEGGSDKGTLGENRNVKEITFVKDSTSYTWNEDGSVCTVRALLDVNSTAEGDNKYEEVATIKNGLIKYDPETNSVVASFDRFASNTMLLREDKVVTLGEVVYEWSEDFSSCVASQDVILNGETVVGTYSEEGVVTKETVEPSLGVAGSYVYVAEFDSFETCTSESFEIPALTIEEVVYEWSEDNSSCVAIIVLSDESVITEEGVVTSEVVKEPTVNSVGKLTYTASFELVESDSKSVDIPRLSPKEGIKVSTFMGEHGGTVSVNGWTITFDEDAAKTISKDSVLYVNCAEDYSSIEILLKDGMFDDTFEGIATVTLPFNGTVEEGHVVKVYYVYGETKVDMNGVVENGKVKFDTTHFSKFVVVDELLPEPQPEEKASFNYWWLIIDGIILVGAFACVGCYVIVSKKEKKGTELE